MTFQLSALLYVYYAFLIIWLIFFVVAIYHMFKFGFKNFTTYLSTLIFIVVAVLLLSTSYYYISRIDWTISIGLFEGFFDAVPGYK